MEKTPETQCQTLMELAKTSLATKQQDTDMKQKEQLADKLESTPEDMAVQPVSTSSNVGETDKLESTPEDMPVQHFSASSKLEDGHSGDKSEMTTEGPLVEEKAAAVLSSQIESNATYSEKTEPDSKGRSVSAQLPAPTDVIRQTGLMPAGTKKQHDTEAGGTATDRNSLVSCPLSKIPENICLWSGKLDNLEEHVKNDHQDLLCGNCVFRCDSLKNNAKLLLFNKEIFLYYKHFSCRDVMSVIVQQVGLTIKEYVYTVDFRSHDDEDDICLNFPAYKTTEPFQPIIDDCTCMVIARKRLDPYVMHGELAMSVGIREFHPSIQMDIVELEGNGESSSEISYEEEEGDLDEEEEEEEEVDLNANIMCPLNKIPEQSCPWDGTLDSLENHVRHTHADILKRSDVFGCSSLKDNAFLILLDTEIFLSYKHFSHTGTMYTVVQQVGITNNNFMFTVTVSSPDKTDDPLLLYSLVRRISVPFEAVFDARECVVITRESLEPFVIKDELHMGVKITKLVG